MGTEGARRERKEKTHNVYSSPIEDGRSFEGPARARRNAFEYENMPRIKITLTAVSYTERDLK